MNIADVCSQGVYCLTPDRALADAAQAMRSRHIGAIVVVAQDAPESPVGILTDRDIVCGQLEKQADLFCLTVGDVMTRNPLTLRTSCGLAEGIALLKKQGVRRAPVVDETGKLIGIVTLDDLLPALARELSTLAKLVGTQAGHEISAPF
jgi:CBS domain-containing protein